MHSTASAAGTKPARPRRGKAVLWGILTLLALILAIGSWWRLTQPKPYRLIGTYPLYQGAVNTALGWRDTVPCLTGFLVREELTRFSLRDWDTGERRWQVTASEPDLQGWPASAKTDYNEQACRAGVSPSGRVLAVMSQAPNQALRVETWKDGRSQGVVSLPVASLPLPAGRGRNTIGNQPIRLFGGNLYAFDDGRCFYTQHLRLGKTVYVYVFALHGKRLLAREVRTTPIDFSVDGQLACYPGVLARVAVKDGRLQYTTITTGVTPGEFAVLGADGAAVHYDGRILRASGKHSPVQTDWEYDTVTVDGRYTLFYRDNLSRAVNLVTGASWQVRMPGYSNGGDATPDGRHILASLVAGPGRLGEFASEHLPSLSDWLPEEYNYIALYRRPGKLIARLRVPMYRYDISAWWPSPDGRSVVMSTAQGCLLYRY